MLKKRVSSRRNFLKLSTAGTAAAILATQAKPAFALTGPSVPLAAGPGNKWPGRIVINFNKNATNAKGTDNASVIEQMVNDSLLNLTGEKSVADAWKTIFPSTLTAQSKIAIKIPIGWNNSKSTTNCYVIKGIVDGLCQMNFGGTSFPAGNIYVYDMNASGGYFGFSDMGLTNTLCPGIHIVGETNWAGGGANGLGYAKTLADCDFLINVPSLRGHWAQMGQVTIGFKNHYGTYVTDHGDTADGAPSHLRDINCLGPVYQKSVLTVVSAIYGQLLGSGPGGSPEIYTPYVNTVDPTCTNQNPNTLFMSTDPVSAEMQAIKIMRINYDNTLPLDAGSMPTYLQASAGYPAPYPLWGGGPNIAAYNIGIIDESSMDIRRITNSPATSTLKNSAAAKHTVVAATPHIDGMRTLIEFRVPADRIGNEGQFKIFNAKGAVVMSMSLKADGLVNHFTWDERDLSGNRVGNGMYVVHFISGAEKVSTGFTLMR